MRDLLHHIHGVDPVAADEAPRVGDEAADVPGMEHSLHGQDIYTGTDTTDKDTNTPTEDTKHWLNKKLLKSLTIKELDLNKERKIKLPFCEIISLFSSPAFGSLFS